MAKCTVCGRALPPLTLGRKVCKWCRMHEAAQRGEESGVQPMMAAPWQGGRTAHMAVTQIILGINVAVFVGMVLAGVSPMQPNGEQLITWGANFGPLTLSGQWWRLLSSVFLHIGILHIGFNMWCLWNLGELCETLYGHVTYFVLYLICGLAGSVASVFWHPLGPPSAGASGAIFGLAGAMLASFWLGEFNMPRFALRGVLRSLSIFVIFNLGFGFISGFTDNAAHIGGLISGFVMGALIARLAPSREQWLQRVLILVLVLGLTVLGFTKMERAFRAATGPGGLDRFVGQLQTVVRAHPENLQARLTLANAYVLQKRYDAALAQYQAVADSGQKVEGVYYGIGRCDFELERYDEALKAYQEEIKRFGDSQTVELALADVYRAQGKTAEADAAAKKAEQLKSAK